MVLYFLAQKAPLRLGPGVANKLFELLRVPAPRGIGVTIGIMLSSAFSMRLDIESPVGGGRLMIEVLNAGVASAMLENFGLERVWAWATGAAKEATAVSNSKILYIVL